MKTLFQNGVIITGNEQQTWYAQGYLVVEDDKIIKVGEGPIHGDLFDRVIDLQGKWLMPGWVNTHSHAGMSLLRGFADDYPLQEWLEQKIWPMEGQFTEETVHWGTSLAVLEMLKSGTTCFADMYDHSHVVAKVVEQSGMRAVLARGIIGLCSEEEQNQKLEQATQFAENWHKQANGRITAMMAPHAPYTCPPDYIERIVNQAQRLHIPIHIHMSETRHEVEQNVSQYGQRPVAHLRDIGVFNCPTLVAHAVHVNDEEISILQQHDVKIAHNPASNLKLGSGIARVPELIEQGLHVSIGTDSVASNNNLDMFQEVRLAALIHKGHEHNPLVIPAKQALKMGTRWGAEALFLPQIGSLEAGKEADFIILNQEQAHLKPLTDPISHIIYSASGQDVLDVYVQGKAVVQNRQCLFLDEERILFEAEHSYQNLNK